MRKEIVNVSSENQGLAIRAVNGIFILQESWMTKKTHNKTKMANSTGNNEFLKTSTN